MNGVAKAIDTVLAISPASPAVEFRGRWWSWGDLNRLRGRVAAIIADSDLGPGTRVGVLMRNRAELIAPILAVFGEHHCLVGFNPNYPDAQLADDIRSGCPAVVVATSEDWDRAPVLAAAKAVGALCIAMPAAPDADAQLLVAFTPETAPSPGRRSAPGTALEMLTSGTTGKPKRIAMPRSNFEAAVLGASVFEAGRGGNDAPKLRSGVQLLMAPFAHIGGLLALMNAIIAARRSCLLEKFSVETFRDAARRHRPRVVSMPPAGLRMILDAKVPAEDISSLSAIRTGTAPLPLELAEEFQSVYNIPVLQNYGATEFGGVAGWTLADHQSVGKAKYGAVGRLNPGVDGRVVDVDSGAPLPSGETGILELRGRQVGDGNSWVRTTDLAVVDADRFLWIKGRTDDAIIRGGFKIQPADIVKALESHECVLEAAVTGAPDPRLGQVPVAAYVAKTGKASPDSAAMLDYLRARLLPYQMPTRVIAVAALPRTDSMKVSRPQLLALFDQPAG
ncbi:class I adenylate-forming enzyme family protein [Sphingobium sp. TKS]|uniref:class I adenylate-forming enzyme family protein n=1 Tax=Sphingobium sp. TKS TaxID=1315974 RepID=UPI00076FE912|nr:class I adenylate-forming enzyme family protein [Sphingobium sp. TKS]AMK25620.1 AMP-dependent synthetase/ligase [Sphingobium sp. TKS]